MRHKNQSNVFSRQYRNGITSEIIPNEVHFRIKGIKVQHEISKFKGKLSNGGLRTQNFHPYNKLLCFTHLNIPEAWNSELQQIVNRNPKINVFLKDYSAGRFSDCLFIVRNLTPWSFSVIHPFCPCQDEVAPCF